MFASRDVCIYFGKKTRIHLLCYTYADYTKVFTRHLNMECFESAVPAIFLSYASTLFMQISYDKRFSHAKPSTPEKFTL